MYVIEFSNVINIKVIFIGKWKYVVLLLFKINVNCIIYSFKI